MDELKDKLPKKRGYPGRYEKLIPILLAIIGLAIIILLLIILAVVIGITPGN